MLVSVIMPVYNVEKYIRKALDSFVYQTLSDIEIICVDDGSTDSSRKIVEEYMEKDKRVKLLTQKNQGAGAARNFGMKHAQGKYLYFFDSDDYCVPELLEKVVNKAELTNADITVLDYFRVDEQTKETVEYKGLDYRLFPRHKETFSYKDVPFKILSIVNPTPWNKLFNREFVLSTGLQFLTLSTTNDITFCALTVAMAERIAYVNEPLMYYRINRKESLTSLKQKKLPNVLAAVNGVIDKARTLPYAEEIDSAIMYFAMDNLIFALEHYAGDFKSKFYRDYYKEIYRIFHSDVFQNAGPDTIVNRKLYRKFEEIKANSYEARLISKCKAKVKTRLKRILFPILGVSVKRFENRMRDVIKKQDQEIAYLKKQMTEAAKREWRILELVDVMSVQLSNVELMLSTQNSGVNTEKRYPRIIVSMTSFPARIGYVPNTLERLMNQTVKPDKIVLWLSEDQFPGGEEELPYRFKELKSRGLEVKWCKGDIKAYKKILPALKEYPEDLIITVDDDLVYGADLVEKLYDAYRMHPGAIIAARAHKIKYTEEGKIAPYKEWEKEVEVPAGTSQGELFLTGGAGTLFPPHIFGEEVFNYEVIKELCPYADDIWINIMASLYKKEIVCIGNNNHLKYVEGTQDERLYDINRKGNDDQLRGLMEHYKGKLSGAYAEC